MVQVILYLLLTSRIFSVCISRNNERKLKNLGAVEYNKRDSFLLILTHVAFYLSAVYEGYRGEKVLQGLLGMAGLALYFLAIFFLFVVIRQLGALWTMKLLIAPERYHRLNRSWLFRRVRHPNYYLNIIPELIGLTMIFGAGLTFLILFPPYLVLLRRRIISEELIMKKLFKDY